MSHYDCYNCGAAMGIDYGYCENCTPKVVFKLKEIYENERLAIEEQYKEKMRKYVNKETKKTYNAYAKTFNKHLPKHYKKKDAMMKLIK